MSLKTTRNKYENQITTVGGTCGIDHRLTGND